LINDVLDLSKIESGKAEWNVSEVDIRAAIEEVLAAMNQTLRERKVRVEAKLADGASRVQVDRDRLIQVVLNLLSNAVKFCPSKNGRIEVALSEADGFVRVDVRDNGAGIRLEDRAIIFEKFRQGGDTLTDKPQGTGLGLPISRHIIEHFGGRLWVDSRPGQGACFSFVLPIGAVAASTGVARQVAQGA
jgi:signal transduction histidine kinase